MKKHKSKEKTSSVLTISSSNREGDIQHAGAISGGHDSGAEDIVEGLIGDLGVVDDDTVCSESVSGLVTLAIFEVGWVALDQTPSADVL